MEKEIKVGIHNEFDFVITDSKTGKEKSRHKSYNIILNNFWAVYISANNATCLNNLHFGSGATVPVATDVKLTSWLGYRALANKAYDFSDFWVNRVVKITGSIRLQDTEFVGSTFGEVGFSNGTSGTTGLLTKSILKDANGNPISITKGTGEILDIFATFYVKIPEIPGVAFTRPAFNSYVSLFSCLIMKSGYTTSYFFSGYRKGELQPQGGGMGQINGGYTFTPSFGYDVANKKVTIVVPNTVAEDGNIGGIGTMILGKDVQVKLPCVGFEQPVLVKEVIAVGDGTTKDFNCAFGLIKDSGTAKLYVNDIEVSATFDYGMPTPQSDIARYMKVIDFYKPSTITNDTGGLILGELYQGNQKPASSEDFVIFENPFYETCKIESMYTSKVNIDSSDDGVTWTFAAASNSAAGATLTIPAAHQSKRYWRARYYSNDTWAISTITSSDYAAKKLIHATIAPPVGATVALTYQPDCIAKDVNHVLNNVSVSMAFNEYTPT